MNRKVSLIIQVIFWLLFLTSLAFARSQSSLGLSGLPAPIIIIALICYVARKRAIGGWLLFYYITLYIRTLYILLAAIETPWRDFSFSLDKISILLAFLTWIAEAFIASFLLAKRFRNPSTVKLLLVVFGFAIGLALLALPIHPEEKRVQILAFLLGLPLIWFTYFIVSDRVEYVLRENKGESWASTFKNEKKNR